jgi:hypothetical protein
MSVRSRGANWQIGLNLSRSEKRIYKALPKSECSFKDAVRIEQALRLKLSKVRHTVKVTVASLVPQYLEWGSACISRP